MADDAQIAVSSGNRVTLDGPGLHVSRDVTDAQAAAILAIILGATVSSAPSATTGPARDGDISIARDVLGSFAEAETLPEFFRRVGPRRNPDKIVTIAQYLTQVEHTKLLTPEDILARFKDVGEPAPGNYSRDLQWTRQNGWLAIDRETGQYYITASGSRAVGQQFSDDVKKATKMKASRARKSKPTLTAGGDEQAL